MDSDDDFTFDLTHSPIERFAGLKREGSDIVMGERYNLDSDTDDDTDGENCLDLTGSTPQTISSTSSTNTSSPSDTSTSPPERPKSPNTLDLFVDDGISEEALVAMGIDVSEIRAQREIEKRLQREAQQLEYAKQVEQQLNANGSGSGSGSSSNNNNNHASEAAAWRNIGLGASTTNGKAPMISNTPNTFVGNSNNNMEYSNKRFRPNETAPFGINGKNKMQAESSTSAPIYTIDSDDDDIVDLTHDYDNGPMHSYGKFTFDKTGLPIYSNGKNTFNNNGSPITLDTHVDDVEEDDDDDDENDDDDMMISPNGASVDAIMHQMYQIHQRQEIQRRYGITMPSPMPGLYDPKSHQFPGHMLPPHFPHNPAGPASSSVPQPNPLSVHQATEQLRQLLESIADEEPPPPESRTGTPEGLKVNLMEHQKIGFQWMCRQETSTNKGGLLSDDMGLGKTVQAMSVMVARPCTNPDPLPDPMSMRGQKLKGRLTPFKTKCTLVICPVSLMQQWYEEITSKTENLSVYIHHGSRSAADPYTLASYDVIITSYTKVRAEFPDEESDATPGPLHPLIYHRVILDEAHTIKNKATGAAKACYRIEATHRWCLTATPIQNKIEELYSLIKFLRIQPYCEWANFREEIITPMKNGSLRSGVMKKVQVIMKAISIRRSKKAEIDGRPILNLPERNIHFTHVDFPAEERQFYNFVDNKVQTDFNQYVDAGTVMQNYSSVLVLLLRLRQACLHPTLTTIDRPVLKDNSEKELENAQTLKQNVVDRLVGMKDELNSVECPICMDAATEPRIIAGCGHILCRECLSSYVNTSTDYGGQKSCPQCRGELRMDTTVPVAIFFKIHIPELAKAEKKEEEELEAKENQVEFESSMKIDTMLDILKKTREDSQGRDKTIIFSQFTQMLDLMERPLMASGFKFGRYDGSMNLKERSQMIEKYRDDPSMEVLLVSTRCGCLGLNLTMANRVILMDVWWNPAMENQAIDRVHRIGQTKDVEVHRLFINDTVEDRILELQKKKQLIADGALGEGSAEKLGRLGLQDMLYLFRGGPLPGMPGRPALPPASSSSCQ